MIEFKNASHFYKNGVQTLKGLNLKIDDGEFVFIVGPSGAGKSTIIKLLMAEERLKSGEITINGRNLSKIRRRHIPKLRREMGVVFQDFRLIENKTVSQNIAFAMEVLGKPRKEINKRVKFLLELIGLPHKADKYPKELSGGEQQRVALARALINSPRMIIADEPTGNVDPVMSMEIMNLFSIINQQGVTIVVVTHESSLVNKYKKRVITIKDGQLVSDQQGGYTL